MKVTPLEMTAFVAALSKPMIEHIRVKYQFNKFNPEIRCDYSARRTTSLGGTKDDGTPYVSLALRSRCNDGFVQLKEYAHIANDPQIGSVEGGWKRVVAALLAHEIAHALQWSKYSRRKMAASTRDGSLSQWPSTDIREHGALWQGIYRDLRVRFVNNEVFKTVAYTVPPPPPVSTAPKRIIDKPFFTVEKNRNGGRHAFYYLTGTKILIGQLFKREGCRVQFCAAGDNKYVHTQFKNQTEARKALIEPLIQIALNANKTLKDSAQP